MLSMESLEKAKEALMDILCYDGKDAPDLEDSPLNALAISTAFVLGAFVLDPNDVDAPDSPERTAIMQETADTVMLVTEHSGAVAGVPQNFDELEALSLRIIETLYANISNYNSPEDTGLSE